MLSASTGIRKTQEEGGLCCPGGRLVRSLVLGEILFPFPVSPKEGDGIMEEPLSPERQIYVNTGGTPGLCSPP